MKTIYQKDLPHIQPPGATLFITFRLAGSLPKEIVQSISDEYAMLTHIISKEGIDKADAVKKRLKLIFKYDKYLHKSNLGPHFLKHPKIAKIVCDSIHFHEGSMFELFAYCVMSNHVHIVLKPNHIKDDEYVLMSKILHSIKSYTASEANKILGRKGQFWKNESFDHYIRSDQSFNRIIKYVMDNPVEANLVKCVADWPWSYSKI